MTKIKKVIFPVGGLGTRFLPATKSMPKEMLPVFNKPIIQYAFEEALAAGVEDFIFITGRNKNAINNHFDNAYELQEVLSAKSKSKELDLTKSWLPEAGHVAFIRQQHPLGLGHAVWCARKFIGNEPFAVILADELLDLPPKGFLSEMVEQYDLLGGKESIVGMAEVDKNETNKYGIADFIEGTDGLCKIKNMVEKPDPKDAPSNYALIGRYILQPEIFDVLENQKKGRGDEIQLTDAMHNMLGNHEFYGAKFSGNRYDCGNPLGLLEANIAFAEKASPVELKQILKKYA